MPLIMDLDRDEYIIADHENHTTDFSSPSDSMDPCLSHFYNLMSSPATLSIICAFLNEYQKPESLNNIKFDDNSSICTEKKVPYYLISPTMRQFVRCFTNNYMRGSWQDEKNISHKYGGDLLEYLLIYDYKIIANEMRKCVNQATKNPFRIELKKYKLNHICEELGLVASSNISLNQSYCSKGKNSVGNETLMLNKSNRIKILDYQTTMRTVFEISMLTENANYLHKPIVDNELIELLPHEYIKRVDNVDLDQMIGLTSHESFYFLDHAFNFTDLVKHAFIYSSLLNKTTDLIEKLINLTNNRSLRSCLKKKLFDFYKIRYHGYEIKTDIIQRNVYSLEFISDIDFYMPLTTQLKYKLERDLANSNRSTSRYFIYRYSYYPTFNYMLNELKGYYKVFEQAYKHYKKKVVPHFSELDFVFGLPILSKNNLTGFKDQAHNYEYPSSEYKLSMLMIGYWSNFAKYGYQFIYFNLFFIFKAYDIS